MESEALLRKVRKIEIRSKYLSNKLFAGDYHSAFKGKGISFSEVRAYQYGDDITHIDWKVTARMNSPYIKLFEEEREQNVFLMVDVSRSVFLGSNTSTKIDILTELAAILSYSALKNNDKVGLLLFSNQIEHYLPAKKGRQHFLLIIRSLLNIKPTFPSTDISAALRYFNSVTNKSSIVFLLSDFRDENYMQTLKITSQKHEVIGIEVSDKLDRELPDEGLVNFQDAESSNPFTGDLNSISFRNIYSDYFNKSRAYLREAFIKSGADYFSISTDKNYLLPLIQFFNTRRSRK